MNSSVSGGCFTQPYYHIQGEKTVDHVGGWREVSSAEDTDGIAGNETEEVWDDSYEWSEKVTYDEWTTDPGDNNVVATVYIRSCGKLAGEVVSAYIAY
ncbi:hypothetical protein [Butyrivibrio sp.]|uniref:hypothetical protein n=1 Tax=Butyrivibrio sp. TaxID=28121 RepID=UPI0025BC5AA1|nr:hypothetical protein [Butyrivibrio sp.]MBQ9303159.1 hypothetical protein [Butyrivibrio sp.]